MPRVRIFFVFPSIKGKNKQYFGEDKAKRPHRKAKVRLGEMLQFFIVAGCFSQHNENHRMHMSILQLLDNNELLRQQSDVEAEYKLHKL